MKTFNATPEEFATGQASVRAREIFKHPNGPRKKRAPLPAPANLDRQVGTITPEQFGRGEAYWTGRRRLGHRMKKSAAIKAVDSLIGSAPVRAACL